MAGQGPASPFNIQRPTTEVRSNAQAAAPNVGVQGGNSRGAAVEASDWGSTGGPSNAIPEFLGRIFAPRLEAVKRDRMFQGFALARSGMSVEEISANTPWFARTFGQTNVEAGATIYTARASAAELAAEMNSNMDELRTKTTEEMGQWLNDKSAALLTGDLLADAVIQKEFLEQSGPMMDMHTKARFAWKQQQASDAQYNNILSQARAYESGTRMQWAYGQQHPDEKPDPLRTQERERLFGDAWQMPQGQTLESYIGTVEKATEAMAREGNWHSIGFIKNSGLYEQLPTENQERIEKRLKTAESRWLQNLEGSPDMQEAYQIRASGAAGVVSPAQLYEQMSAFNRKFKSRYGFDRDYFDDAELKGAITQNAGLVFQAHQRLLTDAAAQERKAKDKLEKDQAEAYTDASYAKMAAQGSLGIASIMSDYDQKRADLAMTSLLELNPDAGFQALKLNFVNAKARWTSPLVKDQIKNRVTGGAGFALNDGITQSYAMWQKMFYMRNPDGSEDGTGMAMANEYFGEFADDMFAYDQLQKAGVRPEDAYQKVFGPEAVYGAGDLRGGEGNTANRTALQSAVSEISPGFWQQMFGAEEISESSKSLIAHHASRDFERMLKQAPHLGPTLIAKQSVQRFLSSGGEIAGKYAWMNGPKQRHLADSLRIPKDIFGGVFDQAVTNRMRKAGLAVDSTTAFEIIRVPDDKDGPRMLITGYNADGVMKAINLTAKDFNEFRNAYAEKYKTFQNFKPNDVQAPITAPTAGRNTL